MPDFRRLEKRYHGSRRTTVSSNVPYCMPSNNQSARSWFQRRDQTMYLGYHYPYSPRCSVTSGDNGYISRTVLSTRFHPCLPAREHIVSRGPLYIRLKSRTEPLTSKTRKQTETETQCLYSPHTIEPLSPPLPTPWTVLSIYPPQSYGPGPWPSIHTPGRVSWPARFRCRCAASPP